MISNLQGTLSGTEIPLVELAISLLFKDNSKFKTPEALILYQQNMMSEDDLFVYCKKQYHKELDNYNLSYIHEDILNFYKGTGVIPLNHIVSRNILHVGILVETEPTYIKVYKNADLVYHYLPIYKYVEYHKIVYGLPDFLYPRLPMKDLLDFIVNEAVNIGASDIVIASGREKASIIFDVRKRWVNAKTYIEKEDVSSLRTYIANLAGSPLVDTTRRPKYYGVNLNQNYRGRVATSSTMFGTATTVRVISNEYLRTSFVELNLTVPVVEFMEEKFFSSKPGIRVMIGETSSGKSTTVLSGINAIMSDGVIHHGFSVEQPVEMLIEGLNQINCETEEDYLANMQAMKRHNPDFVYATEMTDITGKHIMKEANEGKVIFTSLHTNSCATVVSRIQDLTSLSTDRIIENIQCVVLQELIRDDEKDKLFPRNVCIEFTDTLKFEMFGKTTGEIYTILKREEDKWLSIDIRH